LIFAIIFPAVTGIMAGVNLSARCRLAREDPIAPLAQLLRGAVVKLALCH